MPKVILVTGPSAAGKTTACEAFLNKVQGTWAYVGQDDVHGLIRAGYKSANDMREQWDAETQAQWQTSIEVTCDLIKSFHAKNVNCIVDFFAPPNEFSIWKELLQPTDFELVVIMPDLPTALDRNNQKKGTAHLSEDKIISCHKEFTTQAYSETYRLINTTGSDLNVVVDELLETAV